MNGLVCTYIFACSMENEHMVRNGHHLNDETHTITNLIRRKAKKWMKETNDENREMAGLILIGGSSLFFSEKSRDCAHPELHPAFGSNGSLKEARRPLSRRIVVGLVRGSIVSQDAEPTRYFSVNTTHILPFLVVTLLHRQRRIYISYCSRVTNRSTIWRTL